MATRPVFVPGSEVGSLVESIDVEFEWFPGFAHSQKQRSIESLHSSAQAAIGSGSYLEISSKSPDLVGTRLSAFNMTVEGFGPDAIPVECAFQGSKVFEHGGPFVDLYARRPLDAKRDARLMKLWCADRFPISTPRLGTPSNHCLLRLGVPECID